MKNSLQTIFNCFEQEKEDYVNSKYLILPENIFFSKTKPFDTWVGQRYFRLSVTQVSTFIFYFFFDGYLPSHPFLVNYS